MEIVDCRWKKTSSCVCCNICNFSDLSRTLLSNDYRAIL